MRLLKTLLFFGLLVAVVLYASGFFGGERVQPGPGGVDLTEPAPARTAVVERVEVPVEETAVGTVQSRTRIEIAAQVQARVREVDADAGDPVGEGDPLVVLDDRELKARLDQASQALAAARASHERARQAKRSAEALLVQARARDARIRTLIERKAATPEQMEEAEAGRLRAEAGVAEAEAAIAAAAADIERAEKVVAEAAVALGYARIPAPIAGVVSEKLIEPGELAWPGRTLLVVLDPARLRLEARVREGLIGRIANGDRLPVELAAAGRVVEGRLSEIIPSADPASRTFLVRVMFDAPAGVYPGMFGRLRIPAGKRTVVQVPAAAVVRVGQLETVLVRDGERWARRYVTTGRELAGGFVEVLSGLAGGETVGLREAAR